MDIRKSLPERAYQLGYVKSDLYTHRIHTYIVIRMYYIYARQVMDFQSNDKNVLIVLTPQKHCVDTILVASSDYSSCGHKIKPHE